MATTIISVEYDIPGFSERFFGYISPQSLLDADIVVFRPERLSDEIGKPSITDEYSFELQKSTERWQRELTIALEYGKTIFLFLDKYQVASISTGQKEAKGRTVITYKRDYNNYEFLPVSLPPITSKGGTGIVFKGDPIFAAFWKEFGEHLTYESYFTDKVQRPVFVTKTGERPIGGIFKVKKGHLVSLPLLDYSKRRFVRKTAKSEYWTKEALTFGRKLTRLLIDIDKALRSETAGTPPPSWVTDEEFLSVRERELSKKIRDAEENIQQFTEQQKSLQADLKSEQHLKHLLYETGKPLESAVITALKILGYSAENYNDGVLEMDQVIVSPEGDRFIGECEGKDDSAVNVDKFRQLSDNIQADLQREGVGKAAGGILFGNAFRLTAPKDRRDQFTQKCLTNAKRGTILVRTMDLYPVVRYIQRTTDEAYKRLCREAIAASLGGIVNFPPLPSK